MSDTSVKINNKIWVKVKNVIEFKKTFRHDLFVDKTCAKCEFLSVRPGDACQECAAYTGSYRTYSTKTSSSGKKLIGLPMGAINNLKKHVRGKIKITDGRVLNPFKYKIKVDNTILYDYQRKCVKTLVKQLKKRMSVGTLLSAPRTGKTVMGTAIAVALGQKCLILAHQNDLLNQFYSTITNAKLDLTNLGSSLEVKGKRYKELNPKKVVGICKTLDDFKKFDICLATYQTFISKNGKRLMRKVIPLIGTLIVDEVHKSGADCYSLVASKFKPMYRLGMTGTYNRKDGKHALVSDVMGDIIYQTDAAAMKPTVDLIETGFTAANKSGNVAWVTWLRTLERSKTRQKLIVKRAVKDLKSGRSILIPVAHKSQAEDLTFEINKLWGDHIAEYWHGGVPKNKREDILVKARQSKIRCVVAMRQMLLGIDVPRWDCIYEIVPIANPPNFKQEIDRICTESEGKKPPLIRFFVDNIGVSKGCFMSCFGVFKKFDIPFTERSSKALTNILDSRKDKYMDKDKEYKPVSGVRKSPKKSLF